MYIKNVQCANYVLDILKGTNGKLQQKGFLGEGLLLRIFLVCLFPDLNMKNSDYAANFPKLFIIPSHASAKL